MTASVNKVKREKAFRKLNNQISVLSRTATKKDKKLVEQLQEIVSKFSLA